MFQTLRNAWKIPDLRKKILFSLFIILIFRIGSAISVPFVEMETIRDAVSSNTGGFMDYLTLMSGGGFSNASIFALSITPYINASIIIQLLTVAIPPLERMAKDGEAGRKKLGQITRYVTVALGLMLGVAYYFMVKNKYHALTYTSGGWAWFAGIVIVLCFTAGSALMMWLGEQINEKGIGNGISIILFAGIVSRMPTTLYSLYSYMDKGGAYYALAPIAFVSLILMIGFIVWMDNAERRIPVQYAKRVVGRKMYGGQNTHIPIKVNMCGVLPIIFASSILSLPPTIQMFVTVKEGGFWAGFFKIFETTHWAYGIMYFVLIIFFAYFYAAIQYNPIEMANNIRKNSGAIPGIRPGKPTSDYITKILSRLTLLGALLLSVVALFPLLFSQITGAFHHQVNLSLGGTSIIIMVGVALETVKQLESQMMMRHYKGFLD